jgi:integrase/recombinase XerD
MVGEDNVTPGSEDARGLGHPLDCGSARAALAAAFETDRDPLAQHESTFEMLNDDSASVDPFDIFTVEVLDKRDPAASTRRGYRRAITQWTEYMAEVGRHPACPTTAHVHGFISHRRQTHNNKPRTVLTKLHRLHRIYKYWQDDPAFPHTAAFDPFALALATVEFDPPSERDFPWIPLSSLRDYVAEITDIRARTLVVTQLKLGLRASEVCNLQLCDVNLSAPECQQWYSNLGSHPQVADRRDAIFIATKHDRPGNKSTRPRVLPVDDELQRALQAWLLVRPNNDRPWVFLTQQTQTRLDPASVNRAWTDAFHPEYSGSDTARAITSHYGRHRFTTYWRIAQELPRELVQYMRGDVLGEQTTKAGDPNRGLSAIDDYLHAYYEDIESVYRDRMFRLDV